MMSTTGKAISYCGQQRISIRVPLLRLHHDVHTFKGRAIADTHHTIQLMEKERTEYRAALSWMKSVSIQLDPDTGRGLEKFRKAQRHVKSAKTKFDKYTLDCLEKIDLLAAARCNMFSHALVGYQNAILQFAKKTDETYKNTLKNLAKDPHYSFSILKELTQANPNEEEREGATTGEITETQPDDTAADDDQMLFFKDDYKDDVGKKENVLKDVALEIDALLSGVPDLSIGAAETELTSKTRHPTSAAADLLGLSLDDEFSDFMSAPAPFLPSALLTNCVLTDEGGFDFATNLLDSADPMQPLHTHDPDTNGGGKSSEKATDIFSSLLQSFSKPGSSSGAGTDSSASGTLKQSKLSTTGNSSKTAGKDLSGWYQLFAELDPLSNPDAIPSKTDAPNNSMAA
uniref:AH domain-containing protein n=1 Tax=Anopheles maculatus TaxID=74869 RepID=A0A182SE35_9DIPT